MSLAECQINSIDVNFYLQKSLEIFDKNSADETWSKKDKGWKVPSLMPIRVNAQLENKNLQCTLIWVSHLVVLTVRKMTKICRPSWRNDPNLAWQKVTKLFSFFHSSWWWNKEIILTKINTIGKVGIKNGSARVSKMTSFGFWQLHSWVAKRSVHL